MSTGRGRERWWRYVPGDVRPGHLHLVAFLAGTLTVFFDQSATSLLVLLTRPEELLAANSHLGTSHAAAQVGGPSLGASAGCWSAPSARWPSPGRPCWCRSPAAATPPPRCC
jgi:hypothetical protein